MSEYTGKEDNMVKLDPAATASIRVNTPAIDALREVYLDQGNSIRHEVLMAIFELDRRLQALEMKGLR